MDQAQKLIAEHGIYSLNVKKVNNVDILVPKTTWEKVAARLAAFLISLTHTSGFFQSYIDNQFSEVRKIETLLDPHRQIVMDNVTGIFSHKYAHVKQTGISDVLIDTIRSSEIKRVMISWNRAMNQSSNTWMNGFSVSLRADWKMAQQFPENSLSLIEDLSNGEINFNKLRNQLGEFTSEALIECIISGFWPDIGTFWIDIGQLTLPQLQAIRQAPALEKHPFRKFCTLELQKLSEG